MSQLPLLSLLIWLPILGGAALLAMGRLPANAARWTGLLVSLLVLALSIGLVTGLDHANPGMQFVEQAPWIASYDIFYHLGADGIAVALMGRNHPVGILLASLLFGALFQGGAEVAFEVPGFSRDMVVTLQGFIVLFSGAMAYVIAPKVARLLFGRVKAHQGAAHG